MTDNWGDTILRVNPGPIPEARELEGLSSGLSKVRQIVARETAGAVSPRQQLVAVDTLLQRHHDKIAQVISSAPKRHAGALSAADCVRLIYALVEHGTMAECWLELADDRRKLRAPGKTYDLSVVRSQGLRESILNRIRRSFRLANQLMARLPVDRVPELGRQTLRSLQLQMLCIEVRAEFLVIVAPSVAAPPELTAVRALLSRLDTIRVQPDFTQRPTAEQELVWQTAVPLYRMLGDDEGIRRAFDERRRLVAPDIDSRERLLIDMLDSESDDAGKLSLVLELIQLGRSPEVGALYSRERIGRASIFRDVLWRSATSVPLASPFARAIFDAAYDCYSVWLAGCDAARGADIIRIAATWAGSGRIARGTQGPLGQFDIDPECLTRFYFSMETTTKPAMGRSWQLLRQELDRTVGDFLSDDAQGTGTFRFQVAGPVAIAPILATRVNGRAIGTTGRYGYASMTPRAAQVRRAEPRCFDVLVVDRVFGRHAQSVIDAILRVADGENDPIVMEFDSSPNGFELSIADLEQSLSSARRVMFFCHMTSFVAQAPRAAVITGPHGEWGIERLAAHDFGGVREVALIGCASGRPNAFVGDASVAYAVAVAGADEVLYSLWPIHDKLGGEFAAGLLEAVAQGARMSEYLAERYRANTELAAAFVVMQE